MNNTKLTINIKRYFIDIDNTIYERFVIEHLDNTDLLYLLKNDLLSIRLNRNENTNKIGMYLIKTTMYEGGDYNFDDEYIPFTETMNEYHEIKFNPLTGEEFEFIIEDIHYTEEYQKISEKYNSLNGRLSVENCKEQAKLMKFMDSFREDNDIIALKCFN